MSCHVNWIGLEDWSRFTESVKKIITLCGKSSWQTVDSVVTGGSHYSYTVHDEETSEMCASSRNSGPVFHVPFTDLD